MARLLERLRVDHRNMKRLLALLERQLDLVHQAGSADLELAHDVMVYMTSYPDAVHHPREGLIFQAVLERDPGAAGLLDGLAAEHRELAGKGAALLETLRHCVDGAMVRRDRIEAEGRAYLAALRAHMDREDGDAFPLAERLLEGPDWEAIEARLDEREDPVFGPLVEQQYRRLLEHIEQHDDASR